MLPVPLESLSYLELLRQWHTEHHLEAFVLRSTDLAGVAVDVLLFPPIEFSGMASYTDVFKVANIDIQVVFIYDMIALKQAVGRPIDIADIEHLQRIKAQ